MRFRPMIRSPYHDGLFPAPVGLVLVRCEDRRNAATVTFFSEVAHHPTAMWVSLNTASLTHEMVDQCGEFSLVVLSRKQRDIADKCGSNSGRGVDKCAT